jgi:ribosomal protein S18 acetylase RimI-like enzyme
VSTECIRKQDFDTNVFRTPFYRVTDLSAPDFDQQFEKLSGNVPIIIDAKLPADNIVDAVRLQRRQFRKVCMQVELAHPLDRLAVADDSVQVAASMELTDAELKAHAENFKFDRFSLDAFLPEGGKDRLYTEWIRNSVCQSRKEVVHVGRNFCSFAEDEDSLRIDLLSVLDKGKNLGTLLLNGILAEAKKRQKSCVEVVTECENGTAWKLYIRTGFSVTNYYSIFHYVAV